MQFASPQFAGAALRERPAVFDQELATGLPRLGTGANLDALVGEDRADPIFATVDALLTMWQR